MKLFFSSRYIRIFCLVNLILIILLSTSFFLFKQQRYNNIFSYESYSKYSTKISKPNFIIFIKEYKNRFNDIIIQETIFLLLSLSIIFIMLLLLICKINFQIKKSNNNSDNKQLEIDKQVSLQIKKYREKQNLLENELIIKNKIEEDLKKIELNTKKYLDLCNTISNISNEAHIISDSKGIIIQINLITCKVFGYTQNELIGKHVSILSPSYMVDKYSQFIFLYHQFKRSKKKERRKFIRTPDECTAIKKNGDNFPISIIVKEITIQNNDYFVCIIKEL